MDKCAVCQRKNEKCSNPHHLSDGVHHWWSGWPGAFCLGCGADDPNEICLGQGCHCECHNEFWESYEEYCKKEVENQ